MQVMHESPTLDRQAIRDSFAPPPVTGGILPPPLQSLTAAELADQVEQIKIIPESLSTGGDLEALERLRRPLPPDRRLHGVGRAHREQARRHGRASPSRSASSSSCPFREPRIEEVQSADGPGEPILATSDLVILGRRLTHDPMEVRVDLGLAHDRRGDRRAPSHHAAGRSPGRRQVGAGRAPRTTSGRPSSRIAAWSRTSPRSCSSRRSEGSRSPPHRRAPRPTRARRRSRSRRRSAADQRVVLLLNGTSPANPVAYSFRADSRASAADPIVVPLVDVERGDYFVRVQVDGASSPLDLDPASPDFGPEVTI